MAEKLERLKVQYVGGVLNCFKSDAKDGHWLELGIKALFDATENSGKGIGTWILKKNVCLLAGINGPSCGLWRWLDEYGVKARSKSGAGVVEKCKKDGRVYYRIRKEFYQAIEQVLSERA